MPRFGKMLLLLLATTVGVSPLSAQTSDRADKLNRQLTDDERIAMLHGIMALPMQGKPVPPEAIPAAGYIPGVPRLNIPPLFESDASLGVTNPLRIRPNDGATALPSSIALAATFDRDIAFAGGKMIGGEARAKGFNVLLAGGVDLVRDPRNGRNFEYLGEDPLLAGALAGESVRGIQSNQIIATVKHFALNDQETHRHFVNAVIDEQSMRESDLLAFEIAIERGHPGSVMCAYNLVNSAYACGNDFLLNKVLKTDWHYPGWVMSDWGAVYATDFANRGLDQESGEQLDKQVWFGAPLKEAVARGDISKERLADMTGRILRSMEQNGLFDHPAGKPVGAIDYDADRAVSRREAADSIVLLRNQGDILPLASSAKHILVVGGRADLGTLSGGGSSQVFAPNTDPRKVIPLGGEGEMAAWRNMYFQGSAPLAAIRAHAPQAEVQFDDGRYPAATARLAAKADMVVVFANQWMAENEDAPDLSLPDGQDALIDAVAAANPHTVVVLQTGGPVSMPWLDKSAAVLEAWYSGAGGADAIADVLFGQVNPSGRLPVTFPRSLDQTPRPRVSGWDLPDGVQFDSPHPEGAQIGYRWFAQKDQQPLFPFGFGLSYTSFRYTHLVIKGGKSPIISFDVSNVGNRPGKDAVQAYLTAAPKLPALRLVGFDKVSLDPGQTKHVQLTVDPRLLGHFDVAGHRWRIDAGSFGFAVGGSSQDLPLKGEVKLAANEVAP